MMALLKGLLEISAIASLMILITIVIRKSMSKKVNPAIMLLLWSMVLVRLCFPITFDSPIHIFNLMPKSNSIKEVANRSNLVPRPFKNPLVQGSAQPSKGLVDKVEGYGVGELGTPSILPSTKESSSIEENSKAPGAISMWDIVAGLWIIGALSILLIAIRKARLFKRRLLFCRPILDNQIIHMIDRHREDMDIKRNILLLDCNYVRTPVVFGYLKPSILLPKGFVEDMDRGMLNGILLHEICHIRRHDILINYIWLFAKAIHWFNPLVWIAYRLYQDDVEICCDQMVINRLSLEGRMVYSESLIEALRFSRQNPNSVPSIATSLYKSKSKLKERIVRLVNPNKKSKALGGISMLLAIIMLIMGFTTACQKTPDNPTVIGKDGSKLEEMIKSNSGNKVGKNENTSITKYSDSFKGADKNVTININADVAIPKGGMPVVKVEPYKIPMEQVKAMAEVLFQGNPAYETQILMTKGELEEKILELKREISNEEALLERYSKDKETANRVKENYERRIAEYERLHDTAPETHTPKETDWTFHPRDYYIRDEVELEGESYMYEDWAARDDNNSDGNEESEGTAFQATSVIEGYRGAIQVSQFGAFVFGMGSHVYGDFGFWNPEDNKPMDMSKEEAIAMVEDALVKMGITHMELFRCTAYGDPMLYSNSFTSAEDALKAASGDRPTITEPAEGEDVYSYSMTFVPTYEGIAVHDMSPFRNGGSEHGINHSYESISVNVSNGMITYIYWSDPMEQIEVENDDVAIIPFKEATKIFEKQMGLEYTIAKLSRTGIEDWEDEDYEKNEDYEEYRAYYDDIKRGYEEDQEYLNKIESGEIHIKDIELKLMRIRIQNCPGEYRMVPAWMFLGYEELYFKDGKSKIQEPESGELYPYAVINAIDGSIINISEGY